MFLPQPLPSNPMPPAAAACDPGPLPDAPGAIPYKVLADVFDAPVYLKTVPDAAAIGAALRAKHGYLCRYRRRLEDGSGRADDAAYVPFSQVLSDGAPGGGGGGAGGRKGHVEGMRLAATPREDAAAAYEGMAER